MAIPDKPLELNFDPDAVTMGEYEDLSRGSFQAVKAFVTQHGNWTADDLRGVTRAEWLTVYVQIVSRVNELLTPKATGTP